MADVVLRGMTWAHPRGYDPLVAGARLWRGRTGVEIVWEKRSLQDFETHPVEDLAARYDLIVIDHPHVGQITREGCLVPLDAPERAAEGEALAAASVGPSYASYCWRDRQWALPIDAAAQVQAFRPDLIGAAPQHWGDVLDLAGRGAVLCPLRPPHSLMCLYTLCANLGRPCAAEGPELIDAEGGAEALTRLGQLAAHLPEHAYAMDPIVVLEEMAEARSPIACAPLIYGYVSYAAAGFRPRRLAFADIPVAGDIGPAGSALGGTGVAVSAHSRHKAAAADFAWWIASGEAQAGVYAAAGGQPAHAAAWESAAVNAPVADFYRATRATLDGAWLRPRHDGYMPFQDAAAAAINVALRQRADPRATVAKLNAMFRATLRG